MTTTASTDAPEAAGAPASQGAIEMSQDFSSPGAGLPPLLPAPPPRADKNPWVAALLAVFPGLGHVYLGLPAKAMVFFFAWAGSMWGAMNVDPMPFALMIPFAYLYNIVDAYRSAVGRRVRAGGESEDAGFESPAWGGSLVLLGFVLLAHNLGWIDLASLKRFWPVILIVAGGALLMGSLRRRGNGHGLTGA